MPKESERYCVLISEYQYYEWQTIDRPLTDQEQAAVKRLSSHIEVSPTGAWVEC